MRKFFLFFLVAVSYCLLHVVWTPTPAHAFRLRPAIIEIEVKPGGSYTGKVSVTNDESTEQTYFLFVQKFFPKGELGQQEFLPVTDRSGLPGWLETEESAITLKPGESRDVSFSIRPPLDAPVGGHYAALFFSTVSPFQLAQGKILTGARTGSLLLVTVDGAVNRTLEVQEFGLAEPGPFFHLPMAFEALIKNTGNAHAAPQGEITVTNLFGSQSAVVSLNPGRTQVLPGSARRMRVVWQRVAPRETSPGFWHHAWEEVRNFAFGKYQANYAGKTVVFWVWPWHALVVLLGGLLVLLVLARVYGRWVIRRALRS